MTLVLTVLATLVVGGYSINPLGQFPPVAFNPLGAFHGYGKFGIGHPGAGKIEPEKPLELSCASTKEDGYGVNSISATIKEKRSGYGGGLFNSPFTSTFLNFRGAFGHGGGQGLEAVFELFSSQKGGRISLVVTEKAFPAHGCHPDNFGAGLSSRGSPGHGLGLKNAGFGIGGGFAGGFGPGFGGGFASPHQFTGGKGGFGPAPFLPDGVVAEVDLVYGTPKVISLDTLRGYSSLRQLAGRGFIACTDVEADYNGQAKCKGAILSCCAFAYDQAHSNDGGSGSYP